jgi:putative intracellular protease/amidase
MTTKMAILLTDGFEEGEATIIIDMIRRLELEIDVIACQDNIQMHSYHDMYIKADALFEDKKNELYDAIIFVGGPENTDKMGEHQGVIRFIRQHIESDKVICAMCSAGAKVLAKNGLLGSHRYVATANLYKNFDDGEYIDQLVVEDGNFITAKDFGVVFDFAMTIAHRFIAKRRTIVEGKSDVEWHFDHISYLKREF